jgi:hypothetical protein
MSKEKRRNRNRDIVKSMNTPRRDILMEYKIINHLQKVYSKELAGYTYCSDLSLLKPSMFIRYFNLKLDHTTAGLLLRVDKYDNNTIKSLLLKNGNNVLWLIDPKNKYIFYRKRAVKSKFRKMLEELISETE